MRLRNLLKVISHVFCAAGLLELGDLQDSLAKVLAVEQTKEALCGVVDTLSNTELGLVGTLVDPLLNVLLVVDEVLGTHTLVADDEALELQALCDNLHKVADGVLFSRSSVVLRDHTAADDATEVVHGVDRSLEVLTTNLLFLSVRVQFTLVMDSNLRSRSRCRHQWERV